MQISLALNHVGISVYQVEDKTLNLIFLVMLNTINYRFPISIKYIFLGLAFMCFLMGCEDEIPCCPNCPLILDITPDRATPGSIINIRGKNFGTSLGSGGNGSISVGGVLVEVTEIIDDNNINVRVPEGALSGEVVICSVNKHPNYDNLLCSNLSNCEQNDTFALLVQPRANFSWTSTNCKGIIEFENLSSSNSIAKWDFGDPNNVNENHSTDWEPSHAFSEFGTYQVSLQITDTITGLMIDTVQEVTLNKELTYDIVFGSMFLDEFSGNRVSDYFTSAHFQLPGKNLVYLGRHTVGDQHGIKYYIVDLAGNVLVEEFISYGEDRPIINGAKASINGGFLVSGALIKRNGKLEGFIRKYKDDGTEEWRNASDHPFNVYYSNPIEIASGKIFVLEYTDMGGLRSLVTFSQTGSNQSLDSPCNLNSLNVLWGSELAKINDELFVFSTIPNSESRNELQIGLATINDCGVIQQSRTIDAQGHASSVSVDHNGNVIIAGRTSSSINGGRPTNGEDAFFAIYDQNLNEVSPVQFYGGANDDEFSAYFEDNTSGFFFLIGASDSFGEGDNKGSYLVKFEEGQLVNSAYKKLPDSKSLHLQNILNAPDKGYVLQGDVFLSGFYQFYFGRTDCDGNIFD